MDRPNLDEAWADGWATQRANALERVRRLLGSKTDKSRRSLADARDEIVRACETELPSPEAILHHVEVTLRECPRGEARASEVAWWAGVVVHHPSFPEIRLSLYELVTPNHPIREHRDGRAFFEALFHPAR